MRRHPIGLEPNAMATTNAPVSVSSTVDVATIQTANLPGNSLRVNYRFPYFVDELRFLISGVPLADSGIARAATVNDVQVSRAVGSYAMGGGPPIPIAALGPVYFENYGTTTYQHVRLVLPKPLFVKAGESINATVFLSNTDANFAYPSARFTMTAVGRALIPGYQQERRDIPWLSWFNWTLSSAFVQTNTEFRNPFTWPLRVSRLTLSGDLNEVNATDLISRNNVNSLPLVCKIWDSEGYIIVPDNTLIGDAIDIDRRVWTFNRDLGAREQLNVQCQISNPYGVTTTPYTGTQRIRFGLIGTREEAA